MIKLPDENFTKEITKRVFFSIPGEKRQDASVTYRYFEKDEFQSLLDEVKDYGSDIDSDYELMSKVIVNIEGVFDANGKAITYSPEVLKRMMNIIPISHALVKTFFMIQGDTGHEEGRTKN